LCDGIAFDRLLGSSSTSILASWNIR
jgi:hypothetical protein